MARAATLVRVDPHDRRRTAAREQLHDLLEIAVKEHRYRDASQLLSKLVGDEGQGLREPDNSSAGSAPSPKQTTRKFVTMGPPEHAAEDLRRLKR